MRGKRRGCGFPELALGVLVYEHCIAIIFYPPLARRGGAGIGVVEALCDSLLPATIGNIIGGAVFVGMAHWYLHRTPGRSNA